MCFLAPVGAATLDAAMTLTRGSIAGNPRDASGVLSFKGIPYAAAPVGNLRWKAPQPVQPRKNFREATQYGAHCRTSTAFAGHVSNGNPDGSGLARWPAYKDAGSQVLHLGNVIQAGPEEVTARFELLDKFRVNGMFTPPQQQFKNRPHGYF